jgi:hypothetical protein
MRSGYSEEKFDESRDCEVVAEVAHSASRTGQPLLKSEFLMIWEGADFVL